MHAFKLGGLTIHVLNYESPDAADFWDGNWLSVAAVLIAPGSRVEAKGCFLRTDELATFAAELSQLDRTLAGRAVLQTLEPQLQVSLDCDSQGHILLEIELTPDHLQQVHKVSQQVDQTYIGPALRDLRAILVAFPVKSSPIA